MNTKHTKGQWAYAQSANNVDFLIHSDSAILPIAATCEEGVAERYRDLEQAEANAKLIAAAPTMLDALIEAQRLLEIVRKYMPKSIKNSDTFNFENVGANVINAAIRKATI